MLKQLILYIFLAKNLGFSPKKVPKSMAIENPHRRAIEIFFKVWRGSIRMKFQKIYQKTEFESITGKAGKICEVKKMTFGA